MTTLKLLEHGKSYQVFSGTVSGGTTETVLFPTNSDSVLITLFISSVTTSLACTVESLNNVADTTAVGDTISFPTATATTSTSLQRTIPITGGGVRVKLTAVGDAVVAVWAKGVTSEKTLVNYSGTISVTSSGQSAVIDTQGLTSGAFQFNWTGIDAFNATAILQGSNDNSTWNDLGGASGGITLLNTPDGQIWEFTTFTTKYIRLDYTVNSVTTGSGTWELRAV